MERPFSLGYGNRMNTSQSGFRLSGVSVHLADRPVLSGLDLSITEARVGVLGRNGSGKTTLLRLLAGLIRPSSGTVTLDGLDPAGDRSAMLSRLGILFQNPDHQIIFPTVAEEIAFGLRQQGLSTGDAQASARAALASEGRADWADRPTAALSQGQRHWLCLLALLVMRPGTILLDEPFSGLDIATQLQLARRFASLPQRLVTVTHDPAHVSDADRVLWLDAGRVRLDGPPAEVIPAYLDEMERLAAGDA